MIEQNISATLAVEQLCDRRQFRLGSAVENFNPTFALERHNERRIFGIVLQSENVFEIVRLRAAQSELGIFNQYFRHLKLL